MSEENKITVLVATHDVRNAPLPVNYDAAIAALAECASIDECLQWSAQAAALGSYARQAQDRRLEHMATRVRLRAVRRCGELLLQMPDGKPGPGKERRGPSPRHGAAQQAGLSLGQEMMSISVARIPVNKFELEVESPVPPGASSLRRKYALIRRAAHEGIPHGELSDDNSMLAVAALAWLSSMVSGTHKCPPELAAIGCPRGRRAKLRENLQTAVTWCRSVLSVLDAQQETETNGTAIQHEARPS